MKTFTLPDLGEGIHEAEIVDWHVAVGDNVVADQPLLSVETDKAVVEIPSPWSGRIARLHGEPGDIVHTGDAVVEFEAAGADTGAIVGDVAPPERIEKAREPAKPKAAGRPASRRRAVPAARELAGRLGIDLDAVEGTGPDGAITRADVKRAADVAAAGGGGYEPLRGVRRSMARNMALSGREVVPATVTEEVDVEAWPEMPAVTARLVRAIAVAAQAEPALNAAFDGGRNARRLNDTVDVGIAVDTPDGLLVPVLRDAVSLGEEELQTAVQELVERARARKAAPKELAGATISLSNFGGIAGRFASLVVVPPQVAILGAGRIVPTLVPGPRGRPAVHRMLPLSLTFDHRAVTGGEAARFLAAAMADLAKAN